MLYKKKSHLGFTLMEMLVVIVIIAIVIAVLRGCIPNVVSRKDIHVSRKDIPEFLSQYDPAMKTKRDEMVRSLTTTREQLSKLQSLEDSYSSARAKTYVRRQISKVEDQEASLAGILRSLDASIEVAMAAKEIDAVDGGGLQMKESVEIISRADQILRHSNQLSSDVTSLFSEQRKGGDSEDFNSVDSHSEEKVRKAEKPRKADKASDSGNTKWMQDSIIDTGNMGMRTAVIDDDDGWSNLRAQPSTSARIVRRIYPNEIFLVAPAQLDNHSEWGRRWHEVKTDSGETGWMHETVIRYKDR